MDKRAGQLWMTSWEQRPDGSWYLGDAYCEYEATRYGLTPDEIRALVMARGRYCEWGTPWEKICDAEK